MITGGEEGLQVIISEYRGNGGSPKDYRKIVILFHKYEYFTEALIYSTIILSLMDVY